MENWKFKKAADFGATPEERLKSQYREATLAEYFGGSAWRSTAHLYFRIVHRLEVLGKEHLPRQLPFVIAANHTSHLDAVCLESIIDSSIAANVFPIAADDTFFTSRIKSLFTALTVNALPVTRKSPKRSIAEMELLRKRLLEGECAFIIFPEGTRTRDGNMNRFKRGVGMLVANSNVPVIPCYLDGFFEACPPHKKLPRPVKLTVRFAPPRIFSGVESNPDGWATVASELEEAVKELR